MFFCKQKTEYEVRIRYWSSDVCSSDLALDAWVLDPWKFHQFAADCRQIDARHRHVALPQHTLIDALFVHAFGAGHADVAHSKPCIDCNRRHMRRSEEHTSELQSLMRISYAVFCFKKKTFKLHKKTPHIPSVCTINK